MWDSHAFPLWERGSPRLNILYLAWEWGLSQSGPSLPIQPHSPWLAVLWPNAFFLRCDPNLSATRPLLIWVFPQLHSQSEHEPLWTRSAGDMKKNEVSLKAQTLWSSVSFPGLPEQNTANWVIWNLASHSSRIQEFEIKVLAGVYFF